MVLGTTYSSSEINTQCNYTPSTKKEIINMTTVYTFNVSPVPASRPRVTRWGTYFPERYSQFKVDMLKLLEEMDIKEEPLEGILEVSMQFHVQIPKSWSKKKKLSKEGQYCDNTSDIDNYIKAIFDSLNGVLYGDDKQIVKIALAEKRYSSEPKIEFTVKAL